MNPILLLSLLLSSAAVVGCMDKPDIAKSVAIIRQKDSIIAWYQMQRTVDSIIISVNALQIVHMALDRPLRVVSDTIYIDTSKIKTIIYLK